MLFEAVKPTDKDLLAVTDLTRSRSWIELDKRITALAHYLMNECGVAANDHIALHVGNRVEFIESMLAGILVGAWVTPINTHLTKDEASFILENCDAKVLIYDSCNRELVDLFPEIAYLDVESLENLANGYDYVTKIGRDSPAGGTMLYTSGTTGRPKGVKRNKPKTLGEALTRMRSGGALFGLTGAGPHLVTGPLYHAAPMLFALYDLLNGAPMVILPRWNEELFFECIEKYKVCSTHIVPTMMVRLLKHKVNFQADLDSLKLVLHGAAPIAKHTKEKILEWWGDILVEYWGGSEAGTTTMVNSKDWKAHPGTVGKPLEHFEVFVGDEFGNPSDSNEGMLFCRHKQLRQVFEYYKDPEKTRRAHPKAHVFCIGDIGHIDSEGFVYLSGRSSNMIISGGVNIYPAEVEQVLLEHPAVLDCVVYGVANDEWGEEVHAAIQLVNREANLPQAELLEFVARKLAKYKIPRAIKFIENIPRMPTGKVKLADIATL